MVAQKKRRVSKPRKTQKRVLKSKPKFDLDKYFGKVDFGMDGLTYQKMIRANE